MRILAAEQHQPTLVRIECHRMLDTRAGPISCNFFHSPPAHCQVSPCIVPSIAAPPCRNSAEPVEAILDAANRD
jgi:hypothetical protein